MNKVLIVVTSFRAKSDRIYHGSDEWCDGWRFPDRENLELRKREMAKPIPVNSMSELGKVDPIIDSIVWIRGKEPRTFPTAEIFDLISQLRKTSEVYFAYHDEFVGDRIASRLPQEAKRFRPYSLSSGANPEGFKAIISTNRRGENYLNPEGRFDDIFRCFFLDPTDIFALVKHKLTGMLSAIDMDLQIFEHAGFGAEAWKQLAGLYNGGRASEKLKECKIIVFENSISLKRLYEKERTSLPEEKKRALESCWTRLTELLPEDRQSSSGSLIKLDSLYLEVDRIIRGLDHCNLDQVRRNFEKGNLFRQWMDSLDRAIDGIKEVVMADETETVCVGS